MWCDVFPNFKRTIRKAQKIEDGDNDINFISARTKKNMNKIFKKRREAFLIGLTKKKKFLKIILTSFYTENNWKWKALHVQIFFRAEQIFSDCVHFNHSLYKKCNFTVKFFSMSHINTTNCFFLSITFCCTISLIFAPGVCHSKTTRNYIETIKVINLEFSSRSLLVFHIKMH